jgi:hypothetical protein
LRSLAQIQVANIPRQSRLPDLEAALSQEPLQVFLARDRSVLQHVQNRSLPECFIHNE